MATTSWDFDFVHSSVGFTVRHLLVSKVRGRFNKWSGSLRFDPQNPAAASVEVAIDASSVDTNEAQRDGHLRSPDFFDVQNHPTITFKSSRVEKKGDDKLLVTGDLTMRGVTKPVELEVEYGGTIKDPYGKQRAGFTATATIDRKEFGVSWNQALDHGGLAVSDKVALHLEIEATAAVAQANAQASAQV